MATAKRKKRLPVGVAWRIKAGGIGRQPLLNLYSADHQRWRVAGDGQVVPKREGKARRTTFDELVVMAGNGTCLIHVEQMDARSYFVSLGDEKRMVWVDRKGRVRVGEKYE